MFHNHINRHIFYIASLLITKFYICSRGRNNKTKIILSPIKYIKFPFSFFIVTVIDSINSLLTGMKILLLNSIELLSPSSFDLEMILNKFDFVHPVIDGVSISK